MSSNTSPKVEENISNGRLIKEALSSASFIQNAALLFLTVVLSGILVPLLISQFSAAAEERQKAIEIRKARDDAILKAQSKLLDQLSETILTCETLALDVSWYKTSNAQNDALHKRAFERYSDRMVDLVAQWRALASRAQTLASPEVSEKLNAFLARFFLEQDSPLNRLYIGKADEAQWSERHVKNEQMLGQANQLIAEIATDLGIAKDRLHK